MFSISHFSMVEGRGPSLWAGLFVGFALFGLSCTMLSGPTGDDSEALRQKAQRLQKKLDEAPDDTEARRDLGAVYVRLGKPDSARLHLQRVHEKTPDDPKTMYFLGLAHERLGDADRALDLYGQYDDVAGSSRYRELMQGRHDWLRRAEARQTVQARAQGQADTTDLSPQTVAVFPLAYQGSDSTYAPLGRGLGELILTDLSNVGRLQVLERIRLQALFNELELAKTEYVDPSTAPRVGKLIGAGRLIGGAYDVRDGSDGEEKMIDVSLSIVNLTGAVEVPGADTTSGTMEELFDFQNDLVFTLVDQLGVELTAEERAAIEKVPTRNLQAFLAFSRGLRAEDQGRYSLAASHYQRATGLDPNFEAAAQRRKQIQQLERAGGTPSEAVAELTRPATALEPSTIDLQEMRHDNLSSQPTPTRQPAGEQTTASEGLLNEAPSLPPPEGSQ